MTHTNTLASWKQNIAIRLTNAVPTLLLDDGITLADSYLGGTGGWVPDNPGAPTDLGAPASGLSDNVVVSTILGQIQNSQYEFTATVSLPVSFQVYANLTPGLSAAQVRDAVATQARAYLSRATANLPIKVDPTSLVYTSIASQVVGQTTQSERQTYQTGTSQSPIPILSNTLNLLRTKFVVDTTWNIDALYVAPTGGTGETFVEARKYVDTTYNALDPASNTHIIAQINPDTGVVLTAVLNTFGL